MSIWISPVRTVKRFVYCTNRSSPTPANTSPSAAPPDANTRFSVSNSLRRRPLPAPIAARTASSRSLRTIRVRVRFATLAHARRSTSPTVPMRTRSVGRASLVSSSCHPAELIE